MAYVANFLQVSYPLSIWNKEIQHLSNINIVFWSAARNISWEEIALNWNFNKCLINKCTSLIYHYSKANFKPITGILISQLSLSWKARLWIRDIWLKPVMIYKLSFPRKMWNNICNKFHWLWHFNDNDCGEDLLLQWVFF